MSSAVLAEIRETYRQRQDLQRAELSLGAQIEAITRRLTGMTIEERAAYARRLARGGGRDLTSGDARITPVSPAPACHDGDPLGRCSHDPENDGPVIADSAAVLIEDALQVPVAGSRAPDNDPANDEVLSLNASAGSVLLDNARANGGTAAQESRARRVAPGGGQSAGVDPEPYAATGAVPDGADGLLADADLACSAYRAALDTAALAAAPLLDAKRLIAKSRAVHDRHLDTLARQLPVWDAWAAPIKGIGPLSLAQIIGEAGDLALYSNPAKLWKRMGLGLVDGERQRRIANDPELAIRHGYNPRRRALMWIVGDNLIRNRTPGYYDYYLSEKARQCEKLPDAPLLAAHRRAHRHMEKRFLRDLWRAWHAAIVTLPTGKNLPLTLAGGQEAVDD